jgi:hypothetical protein
VARRLLSREKTMLLLTNKNGLREWFDVDGEHRIVRRGELAHDAGTSDWAPLAAGRVHTLGTGIAVGTNADGRLEAFAVDLKDGRLYHSCQLAPSTGPWSDWEPLRCGGVRLSMAISVARDAVGRLVVFALAHPPSAPTNVYHATQDPTQLGGWSRLQPLSLDPMVAFAIDVPVLLPDGRLSVTVLSQRTSRRGSHESHQAMPLANTWSRWEPVHFMEFSSR